MSVRVKSRRRVVKFAVCATVLCICACGIVVLRKWQYESKAVAARAEGISAFERGDYEVGLHKVGSFLQRHPNDVDTLFVYAQCRAEVPDIDGKQLYEAIALYRHLLNLRPEHVEAQHKLLELYVSNGFNTETLDLASALLATDPRDLPALRGKAIAAGRIRRFDEAAKAAEEYTALAPRDLEMQTLLLEVKQLTGETPQQMLLWAHNLHDAHTDWPELELLCSAAHSLANDRSGAVEWARKAASRGAADPAFVSLLVAQMDSLGMFDESMHALGAASDGGDRRIRRVLLSRLLESSAHSEVVTRLKGLTPEDPAADTELLAIQAIGLAESGARDKAVAVADALSSRTDATSRAWAPLLRAKFGSEMPEQGFVIAACQAAGEQLSARAHVSLWLGDAYAALGERGLALACWERASREAPVWQTPLTRLSSANMELGRYALAIAQGRQARERAPKDVDVLLVLADALDAEIRVAGTDDTATRELAAVVEEVKKIAPDDDRILPFRARCLASQGERDAAEALLKNAASAVPPAGQSTLLRLWSVGRSLKLQSCGACLDSFENAYGMTPELAFVRASILLESGQAKAGRSLIERARPSAAITRGGGSGVPEWDVARARYLEASIDPDAGGTWTRLADAYPRDATFQWMAIAAPSVQSDRVFRERAISRVRDQAGRNGTSWRLAQATLLLEGPLDDRKLMEAASLLGDVTRDAPELLQPRVLLAACQERLGDVAGATQQLAVAHGLFTGTPSVSLELARLYQVQGDTAKSVELLERLKTAPDLTVEQRRTAAKLLMSQGRPDLGLALLGEDVAGGVPTADLLAAELFRRRGDLRRAESVCKELMKRPDEDVVRFAADLFASQGRTAEAASALDLLGRCNLSPGREALVRGEFLTQYGDQVHAAEQLRAAVVAAPSNVSFRWSLARFCLVQGRFDEAIAVAREGTAMEINKELGAEDAVKRVGLHALLANEGVARRTSADPASRPLYLYVLSGQGSTDAVIEALGTLAEANDGQNVGQSLTKLRALAESNPKVLCLQTVAVEKLIAAGLTEDGVRIATRSMQTFPYSPEPAALATRVLTVLGRWPEAAIAASEWRRRSGGITSGADRALAHAYVMQGDPAKAVSLLSQYILNERGGPVTGDQDMTALRAAYAEALVASGKSQDAVTLLGKMLNSSRAWRAAWMRVAVSGIADPTVTVDWLRQTELNIPADSHGEVVLLAWAWATLAERTGDPTHASTARLLIERCNGLLRSGAELSPADALALGMLDGRYENWESAIKAYRYVLTKQPEDAVALNNLAIILSRTDDGLDEALNLATRAANSVHPNRANFQETLATILSRAKRYADAVQSMRMALEAQPNNGPWQIHLVYLLAESGENVQAREELIRFSQRGLDESKLPVEARDRLADVRRKLNASAGANG